MASESQEKQTVSVTLPTELLEWVETEANAVGVDTETLLVQLLASYQTVTNHSKAVTDESVLLDGSAVGNAGESEFEERLRTELESSLEQRVETLQAEFDEKIQDVRRRVIQVKKETDRKAPEEHTHREFGEIESLAEDVDSLAKQLEQLQSTVDILDSTLTDVETQTDEISAHGARLDELEKRIRTVGWIVRDLREEQESSTARETVKQIKQTAAREDIERATCENCGAGVTLSLLTEPRCPHCEATVTNVKPAVGWFRSPTLTAASQLESGKET